MTVCLRHSVLSSVLVMLLAWMWAALPAQAQRSGQELEVYDGVTIDERVGDFVDLEATFYDEDGEEVRIGDFFDGETPVVLSLVYHDCPMLCNLILDGVTESLVDLQWTPGKEFEMLTVSFNSLETPDVAARQKERYLEQLGRPEAAAGWHFMTGSEEEIARLTESVGFEFSWIEERQEFAHPAVLIFLSGEGEIARYLHGTHFPERYMRNALVEASGGNVGNWLDQAIMYCFQYDPNANSYVVHATNVMKIGSLLAAITLGLVLLMFFRREGAQHNRWDAEVSAAT